MTGTQVRLPNRPIVTPAILDPILADLRQAKDSVEKALVALRDESPDRWKRQVDLAGRHCARAIMTLELLVSALYTE